MPVFNRQRAAEYAIGWALSRHPNFPDYSGNGQGGDCTNFVSQAMLEGGWTQVQGIRFDRTAWWAEKTKASHSWAGAEPFATFLKYSGRAKECERGELGLADIVQIRNPDGKLHHTMIVTKFFSRRGEHPTAIDEVYVSYHSRDVRNNLLSKIEMSDAYKSHKFVYWKVANVFADHFSTTMSPMPGWASAGA